MHTSLEDNYFDGIKRIPLMDASAERAAAHRIREARVALYTALLRYPLLLTPILESISEDVASFEQEVQAEHANALAVSRQLGTRPSAGARAAAAAVLERLAQQLAAADPSCELADRIVADVEALASGAAGGSGLDVRPPSSGNQAFRRYLSSLRGARVAHTAARHAMVKANLRLVVTMAGRVRHRSDLPLADLVQEGNLGLLTAVDRFDPERGVRFSTYGTWWIRNAIGRGIVGKGRMVRIPQQLENLAGAIARARAKVEQTEGRSAETAELAELTGAPVETIERLQRAPLQRKAPSTSSAGMPDSLTDPIEAVADEDPGVETRLCSEELEDAMIDAMDELRPIELDILRHRFGLDGVPAVSLREIGERHGLSRERIRQLQKGALAKLASCLRERGHVPHAA